MPIYHLEFQPPVDMTNVNGLKQLQSALHRTPGLVIQRTELDVESHKINYPQMNPNMAVEVIVLSTEMALLRIRALNQNLQSEREILDASSDYFLNDQPTHQGGSVTTIDGKFPMGFIITSKKGEELRRKFLFGGIEYRP